MTIFFRSLLVPLTCLVALSACASQSPAASGDGGGTTSPAATTTSAAAADTVSAVTLRRSGGLKPMILLRVFAAGQPPPKGFTAADVGRALAAAQEFLQTGAQVKPVIRTACCDRYSYQVVISMADGSSRSFGTADGVAQPRPFDTLLRLIA